MLLKEKALHMSMLPKKINRSVTTILSSIYPNSFCEFWVHIYTYGLAMNLIVWIILTALCTDNI